MVNVVTRETDELIGTWVFNDNVTGLPNSWIPEDQEYVLDFISDGVSYFKIALGNQSLKYLKDKVRADYPYNTSNGWSKPAYKTIKIIDTSSLTNREEFTTWLKANATKQSNGGDTIMSKILNTRIKLKYDTFEN